MSPLTQKLSGSGKLHNTRIAVTVENNEEFNSLNDRLGFFLFFCFSNWKKNHSCESIITLLHEGSVFCVFEVVQSYTYYIINKKEIK